MKVNDAEPVPLAKEPGHAEPNDAIWCADVPGVKPGDRFKYVVGYNGTTGEFNDPRARRLTSADEKAWSVVVERVAPGPPFAAPALNQMVIYELHIGSFHAGGGADLQSHFSFAGASEKLDYLKELGVNAVEVMPVNETVQDPHHKPSDYNWGYGALQFYAVKSAYGTPAEFKAFVEQCHARGIAVILDVVYNHLTGKNSLSKWGGFSSADEPDGFYIYGNGRGRTPWGPRPNFARPQVRQYIEDSALAWLSEYGVDGLRCDSTANIRSLDGGRTPNPEGADMLRNVNRGYQTADPMHPTKLIIAEDLRSLDEITSGVDHGGYGFASQWDDGLCTALRKAVTHAKDAEIDMPALKAALERKLGGDVFARVVYSENHDQVGHPDDHGAGKSLIRVPALIDSAHPESLQSKQLSTLAAAIVFSAPGVPMIFQGQEMLETRTFEFLRAIPVDWDRPAAFGGILKMYRDLIALRRNLNGNTAGLAGQKVNVFHCDGQDRTLAYHRWNKGGAGDDVVVAVNLSASPLPALRIGLPRDGKWNVRFNSAASLYDSEFNDGNCSGTTAELGAFDGLDFSGRVSLAPYSVAIFSQD